MNIVLHAHELCVLTDELDNEYPQNLLLDLADRREEHAGLNGKLSLNAIEQIPLCLFAEKAQTQQAIVALLLLQCFPYTLGQLVGNDRPHEPPRH